MKTLSLKSNTSTNCLHNMRQGAMANAFTSAGFSAARPVTQQRSKQDVGEARNRKQKHDATRAWKMAVKPYTQHLMATYPDVFNPKASKPLMIGIHKQLLQLRPKGTSVKTVRAAVHRWCRQPTYQSTLVVGAIRFDPNGRPAGEVTADQIKHLQEGGM